MSESKLQPSIRFREFYGNWKEKQLGKNCLFFSGGTPSVGISIYYNGSIPFIKSGEIYSDCTEEYITEEGLSSSSAKMVEVGDILYALYGATSGNVSISKITGAINQAILCIRPQSDSRAFLKEQLIHNKSRILSRYLQGGQGNLSADIIKKLKLFFPEIIEQEKIASFLTTVDKHIDLLIQKRDELEQYKKGVMQQVFNREIRFKSDKGNDFPEWKETNMSKIGRIYNGLTGKSKENFGFGKPYIQYMQIFSNSKIDITQFGFVDVDENDNQNKVQKGDVFFTTSSETPNEIGTASVLLEDVGEVYLNSFCFGFRPNSISELVPEFAQFLFRSNQVRRKIIRLAQGSTRYNMSKVEFMKLTIMMPTSEEQKKIASFLSAIDNKIEKVNSQIDFKRNWKKGLLQQMFV